MRVASAPVWCRVRAPVLALGASAVALTSNGPGRGGSGVVGVNWRRRRLLPTTNRELVAIAAPAIIGLSMPVAASGIATTL